jgi:Acyl-CoA carboxylase epsilon subunit
VNVDDIRVRGNATVEEVAAIVASLQARERPTNTPNRFEQWRRQRLAVLRDNN